MRYRYFISFTYGTSTGFGFANIELRRDQPITGHDDITRIGNDLAGQFKHPWAVVTNFQQYEEPRTAFDE